MPLALAPGRQGGGPLVPHYSRTFDNDKPVAEARPAAIPEGPFTLFSSIWGPRCEWCDARDFVDHEDVLFERFASDWAIVLRLGVAKMIADNDADVRFARLVY